MSKLPLLHNPILPGLLLLASATVAFMLANSPLASQYHAFTSATLLFPVDGLHFPTTIQLWVNDLLMAIFFLVVGLEIKKELLVGNLSTWRSAMLPAAGALGGMLLPAMIYLALNPAGAESRGWGVPMATDIAFAIGVISLLGSRISAPIKVFLTALAIVDDLGAVVVIAFFYSTGIGPIYLALGLGVLGLITICNFNGIVRLRSYLFLGVILWVLSLEAGIHPTIAGVLLAFGIPLSSGEHLIQKLHPLIGFLVMPIFAFVNAGVTLEGSIWESLTHPVGVGVLLGLFLGKPIGITLFSWLACSMRLAKLPQGSSFRELFGVAMIAGIGFTMSIFIASLAFATPLLLSVSKVGIFAGSIGSAIFGTLFLLNFDD